MNQIKYFFVSTTLLLLLGLSFLNSSPKQESIVEMNTSQIMQTLFALEENGKTFANLPKTTQVYIQSKKEINLGWYRLSALPKSFGKLQSIEVLFLHKNYFTQMPEVLGELKNLKKLHFMLNPLQSLSESIGNLKKLEFLNLPYNRLKTLPNSIGKLENLTFLDLHNNQITHLPESMGQLRSLEKLYINNNQLKSLPNSIGKLKNLRELHIGGNEFSPEEIQKIRMLLPNCSISTEAGF
ncbi:MAG: leucine-rich repeat domain-containing protein [Spirochaetota bacterium]